MLADPSAGRSFISHCCRRAAPDAFIGAWKAHAYRLASPAAPPHPRFFKPSPEISSRCGKFSPAAHPFSQTSFAIECALREAFPGTRTAALAFRSKRCLVIETENADIKKFAGTLGIHEIIRVEKIPLDRRHNAKTDYPALRALLDKITYPTPKLP